MPFSPYDNLPTLTKKQALEILKTPINKLKLSSDYYKAVFHLEKYPSKETERALIKLISSSDKIQAVSIARRKAVEILGRLGYKRSIPIIQKLLKSEDPYLVENAAWALQELSCEDIKVHKFIGTLLNDSKQNLRVLIQALSKMNALNELPKIQLILNKPGVKPGVRGAAIAAIYNLSGSTEHIHELKEYLRFTNQNDRQSAVQDIVDAKAFNLLPEVLKTPISPSFRINALIKIWPNNFTNFRGMSFFKLLESVIVDNPLNINVVDKYKSNPQIKDLINGLFSTNFSQAYLASSFLQTKRLSDIWPYISNSWSLFEKDYGAIYFLILTLREMHILDNDIRNKISKMLLNCLFGEWPQYMKFRPAAIISLSKLDYNIFLDLTPKLFDENVEKNWLCRYSALFCLGNISKDNRKIVCKEYIGKCLTDNNKLVRSKANKLL